MLDGTSKHNRLIQLAAEIDSKGWWRFPEEDETGVRGFLGTDPIFIVGDQPSTNPWNYYDRGRRAFYDRLSSLGLKNAHLSDLYKRRGRARELERGLPADFAIHLAFFRAEVQLLSPTRIVALGALAYDLILEHVPELTPVLSRMWHFAYVVRTQKFSQYEAHMRSVILNEQSSTQYSEPDPVFLKRQSSPRSDHSTARSNSSSVRVSSIPAGAHARKWTLRRDNNAHHHGIVRLAESPLYLDLSWRNDAASPVKHVGIFRLDLNDLLAGQFIRYEPAGTAGHEVRLRIVLRPDSSFCVQVNTNGPAFDLL